MRAALPFGLAALIIAGCGTTTHATPYEHPATAAKRSHEALKEQPLSRDVAMTLPNGWKRASSSMFANVALDAHVDLMVGKSSKSLELELKQFCRMLTVQGWHCENGMLADDGSEGSFPYDTPRRKGLIAIRHYADGTAIVLKGEWPAESDQKAHSDFAAIFRTIALQ
jgi:hypothetical protein